MSQCQLWYVMASLVSSSMKTRRFIFMWPLVSLGGWQPWHRCLEPPDTSDTDATDEEVDAELLSLLNLWSDKSKGDWGGATHNPCLLWPLSLPHWHAQPHSGKARWGLCLGTSHQSAATGMFTGHGDKSLLWKLNSIEVGGIEWGQLGSLGLMCSSVMAWVIIHWPSPRLAGLALSWAGLPTQLRPPDSINAVSSGLPKLSPSPSDHHL